ncbi:NUDIX family hydrolase [Nitzschia inconspicua]|uniref:NUDIX family hydrolase n=1 Tax=Nitzschia inconspicua TaxID=303405 RepID=A0A9K3LIB5_9STRA|nr:NUDIX family hydrolase [Nitzschia inconspicua]
MTTNYRRRLLLPPFFYFATSTRSFSAPLKFQFRPQFSWTNNNSSTQRVGQFSNTNSGILSNCHRRFTTSISESSNDINNMSDDDKTSLPSIESSAVVGKTKWLELRTMTYKDQEGKERQWDYATRTTKQSVDKADAVIIIPLLQKKGTAGEEDLILDTLLVEQFRPPVRQPTLEFPAGLIDKDETPESAALRELKEETGYVGSTATVMPTTVSRIVCMSPGLADETVQVVLVHVDLDHPDNVNPQAQPDAGEHITVRRVSLKDGFQTMLDEESSPMAIQGLYLFAMGLEIGKKINKMKK